MEEIRDEIRGKGLKATPQRVEVLKTLRENPNHPTAEQVFENIRSRHPSVSAGTVYHILDKFVEAGLVKRICTEKNAIRYDAIYERHHHLVVEGDDGRLIDYHNEKLNKLLDDFFSGVEIEGIRVKDYQLRIIGEAEKKGNK